MTNSFVNAVLSDNAKADYNAMSRTENGALTYKSSSLKTLDLFSTIGSASASFSKVNRWAPRASDSEYLNLFKDAFIENSDLAVRCMLWARDVREGAGRRKVFKDVLRHLENTNVPVLLKILNKIPDLGSWKDFFEGSKTKDGAFLFKNPLVQKHVFKMVKNALDSGDGLCAKYMPRQGAFASMYRSYFKIDPREYRKMLVNMSNTVEQNMCAGAWGDINYSHVPSLAHKRLTKAFKKRDGVRYAEYLAELAKPKEDRSKDVKINAKAVYPHDVYDLIVRRGEVATAEAMWEALPDYMEGSENCNILPMVDVSGSMTWYSNGSVMPMDVSVSLGLYLSERNRGPFRDMILTFETSSKLMKLSGKTLSDRIHEVERLPWGGSTNIQSAFNTVLATAKRNKVPASDMPTHILIISDMEFDACVGGGTNFDGIRKQYSDAGYSLPRIIFWNVNASVGNSPVKFDTNKTAMVSGFSPSIMKSILSNKIDVFTPENVMLETLMVPRYEWNS